MPVLAWLAVAARDERKYSYALSYPVAVPCIGNAMNYARELMSGNGRKVVCAFGEHSGNIGAAYSGSLNLDYSPSAAAFRHGDILKSQVTYVMEIVRFHLFTIA